MSFSMTTFTAPSGAFAAVGGFRTGEEVPGSFAPVYNPAVLEKYLGSYETRTVFEFGSDEWSAAVRKYSTRVTSADFDTYGGKLIELTHHVTTTEPHCSLGPLRGAAKPCVLAEVMSRGACEYEFFNFQESTNAANHPRVIRDLAEIVRRNDPGEEVYRINITDTAKGGHGINTLVGLMARVKESVPAFRNQRWKLDLNLIHDTSANISNIKAVRGLRKEGWFDIELNPYPVPSLIVEDFDPALAFSLEWNGERHVFKPCSVPGEFLYQVGNEIHLIHSENCYLTFEELYSIAITQWLETAPDLKQVGVVWHEFQDK